MIDINLSDQSVRLFREYLLKWGEDNIEIYPWRFQKDAYAILASEFMLHRTQTRQVVPIYSRFLENFPSLDVIALSDRKDIESSLKSLGLEWRIKGMVNALIEIHNRFGKVPDNYQDLVSIRGIGPYIAGATICFTKNVPITIIDSNIVRVVGRVFGHNLCGEARRKKPIIEAITALCSPNEPRKYYYSIIDLAHKVCKPSNPFCDICPLASMPCMFLTAK